MGIKNLALLASTLAAVATASPISHLSKRELDEYDSNVQIHESCSASERETLMSAMEDVYNITK